MFKKLYNKKLYKHLLITGIILITILQNQAFSSEKLQKLPEIIVTAN